MDSFLAACKQLASVILGVDSHSSAPTKAGEQTWVQDMLLVFADDCTSMLSILAAVLVARAIMQRCFGWPKLLRPRKQKKNKKVEGASCLPVAKEENAEACSGSCVVPPAPAPRPRGPTADLRVFTVAIRDGRASELPRLLDEAAARRVGSDTAEQTLSDVVSCLRMCIAGGCFGEGLAAYDHMATRLNAGCGQLWSMLLYCAVEVREFRRCAAFMEKVWEQGTPSMKDLLNMSRCFTQHGDVQGLVKLVQQYQASGVNVDTLTRNRILSACIACGKMEIAEAVIAETQEIPLDIIGYHALIKGHSQSGNLRRCLELYELLCKNLEPTRITYGLLLDACVDAKCIEEARKVFSDLQAFSGVINVVHYTTFIKCLVSDGNLMEAVRIFENMLATPGLKPDTGSWHCLVKALAESGHVEESARALEGMHKLGLEFDPMAFTMVLNGLSVKKLPTKEVVTTFERLLKIGMEPTTPILSVTLKGFSRSEAWVQAEAFLHSAQSRFGILPEQRLYAQLNRAKRMSSTHSRFQR